MSHQNWLRGRTVVYNPLPQAAPKPKRFHVGRILWSALKKTCMVIGAVFLFSAVVGVIASSTTGGNSLPDLPDKMVLTLRLNGAFPEENGYSQYMSLLKSWKEPLSLRHAIDAIDQGAVDPRVQALAIKADSAGYDISQLQELREAIVRFKANGKKTYIFSESYGGSGYGLGLYYLASAFDEIWIQPVGVVSIGGISAEMPFFKDVMAKYGVEAQFFQRKEYKNAMEHLTSNKMSAASREETQGLLSNLAAQMVLPIKSGRTELKDDFLKLMDLGMLTDQAALDAGLVDRIDYEDVLLNDLDAAYPKAGLVSLELYSGVRQNDHFSLGQKNVSVAVIHVNGMILSGSASRSPYGFDEDVAAADDIVAALHEAGRDKRIKSVILRINSPGGSPSASESIARAVAYVRNEKKKPVYVSMGSVAASGGYWVAAGADKIYAMDSTLTGSIGVVGGKVNLGKLWQKYDVNWDRVAIGKNSGMMSMNTPFSPSEQKQFELTLDSTYDYFIERVSKGRNMTPEQVEEVAKGHVWTGQQAKAKGLVDEIGGMNAVLDEIAQKNGLRSRYNLTVINLPSVEDPFDILFDLLGVQARVSVPPFLSGAVSAANTLSAFGKEPRLAVDPSLPDMRW